MQVVSILMLFFVAYVASEHVRYTGCGVGNTVMSVSISPCNAVPVANLMVCSLKHGMKVRVDAAILAIADCSELETVVLANINDRMIPFPDSESNPCLHNISPSCPLVKGRLYLYHFVFDVKKYYPTGNMEVMFSIRCKKTEVTIACVRLPLIIRRNPKLTYRN
ncbi:uncharacterized protein LOC118183241 [Stegodyphus dumicola]|uniref:uncharacterized protein LOC118183241 n=1 Tax=Stegodyphus dumicola TaxID=202533 RepID=UPI0015B1F6B0|nr:uncharacterized protein LOC118183241 [Stegodyphus dumicola]